MLHTIWEKWLAFGEYLGTYMSNGLLTVFYFSLFGIPGICFSYFKDIVGKTYHNDSYFSDDVSDLQVPSIDDAMEI